jgi:hypothetical protein
MVDFTSLRCRKQQSDARRAAEISTLATDHVALPYPAIGVALAHLTCGTISSPSGARPLVEEGDPTMMSRLFRHVASVLCNHEWATRRDTSHVYLECVRCLATTPGVEYGRVLTRSAVAVQGESMHAAEAA